MLKTPLAYLSVAALGLTLAAAPARSAEEVTLGAGDRGGANYAFGRAICRLLDRAVEGITCSLSPASGGDAAASFATLVDLRNGSIEIGIARSDWQHYAVTKTGPVEHMAGSFDTIRSLFSLHSQPFTLVARKDAGIAELADLKGKRVNLGKPYSSDRASMEMVLAAQAWTARDFVLVEELPTDQQSLAFCHDRVQAAYYVVSHPDPDVARLAKLCDARLVPVAGPAIDKLVAATPYLAATTIPGGVYPGSSDPVKTFGATLTVVSSTDVSEDVVYRFVKGLFDNLERLKKTHPALRALTPGDMARTGLTAPLHAGAARFFREQGLM
ncbi:MAG: TAXI family TRAP transporter solute-binding subunit [Hyphomicrobiales bacterium]|nr:TAXI family TRAP transporter solute-binding subunit [Hyphomicrobiales bacterium]